MKLWRFAPPTHCIRDGLVMREDHSSCPFYVPFICCSTVQESVKAQGKLRRLASDVQNVGLDCKFVVDSRCMHLNFILLGNCCYCKPQVLSFDLHAGTLRVERNGPSPSVIIPYKYRAVEGRKWGQHPKIHRTTDEPGEVRTSRHLTD